MKILNLFLREHLLLAFALVLVSSYTISSSVFPVIIYLSYVKKLTKKPNDRSSHVTITFNFFQSLNLII